MPQPRAQEAGAVYTPFQSAAGGSLRTVQPNRNLASPKLHHKNVGPAVPHEIKEMFPQLIGGAHGGDGLQGFVWRSQAFGRKDEATGRSLKPIQEETQWLHQ